MPTIRSVIVSFLAVAVGCGAADMDVDPADLAIRDLLGLDPKIAVAWDASERAAARGVLEQALDEQAVPVDEGLFEAPVETALEELDRERARDGLPPLLFVRARLDEDGVQLAGVGAKGLRVEPGFERAAARLMETEQPELVDAPKAPFVAALVGGHRLLVNPIVRATIDPASASASASAPASDPALALAPPPPSPPPSVMYSLGNPYNFYGSVAECAFAYQQRCADCLASGGCQPVTRDASSVADECAQLEANGGVGYVELCANLSLAILTVSRCVENDAPTCPQVRSAGNQLTLLTANEAFLQDASCLAALDGCLTEIYGAPAGTFTLVDGGVGGGGGGEPRTVDLGCGDCDSDASCNFSPECDPQCDTTCSGGKCGDCSSDSQTGGTSGTESGSCGDCGGSSDSSTDSGSSDCQGSSCDCGSSSGDTSSGGGGSGGCECGSSGDSSSSGGSSGGSSGCDCGSSGDSSSSGGGGGGSSSCNNNCRIGRAREAGRRISTAASIVWSFVPLVVLALWRRRETRRRGAEPPAAEVQP